MSQTFDFQFNMEQLLKIAEIQKQAFKKDQPIQHQQYISTLIQKDIYEKFLKMLSEDQSVNVTSVQKSSKNKRSKKRKNILGGRDKVKNDALNRSIQKEESDALSGQNVDFAA